MGAATWGAVLFPAEASVDVHGIQTCAKSEIEIIKGSSFATGIEIEYFFLIL